MRKQTMVILWCFVFIFSGLGEIWINKAYALDLKGKITNVKQRGGGNFHVKLKGHTFRFMPNRVSYKIVIAGKPATQSDLKVGMICRLQYTAVKKRGKMITAIEAIDCAKQK